MRISPVPPPHLLRAFISLTFVFALKLCEGDTNFFGGNYLATPASEHAFEVIARLVAHFRPENVFIVSKW
jgi:hypothetical protein